MKKRMIALLLAAVLTLALVPAALAAETTEADRAEILAALEIMVGDYDGNLNLGAPVTRAEFTKMAVAASALRGSVGNAASVSPYPDVPRDSWSAPWIQAAVQAGLVRGNLKGYFEPDRQITLAEGVTIAMRLLGYSDSDFTGTYPAGQMAMYRNLKLDKNISASQDSSMTRRDAMNLFYNLMVTKNKSGMYYLNTIQPVATVVSSAGEIDRIALFGSVMEGPVVATTGWQNAVPFDTNGARVYRDGAVAGVSAIQSLDVVYYSKPMRTLWAYHTRVTGTLEQISPNAASPTSIVVAGKSYAVEGSQAAYDLSDLGGYRIGDPITLLLGRTGGVAAVRRPEEAGSAVLYGVVTSVTNKSYDDGKGGDYNADAVTVMATNGSQFIYEAQSKYLKAGDLVQVNTSGGTVKVERLNPTRLTGSMNSAATRLGDYNLASDVEILDTYKKSGVMRIFPSRLTGVEFKDEMVRFYALNERGEISCLILNDVSGDLHQYGVLTDVTEYAYGMEIGGSYTYDLGGVTSTYPSANKTLGLKEGPFKLMVDGSDIAMKNLSEIRIDAIDGNTVISSGYQRYSLAEQVQVYILSDHKYSYSGLSRVTDGGYTLYGYYDRPEAEGGRIRVIIAKEE